MSRPQISRRQLIGLVAALLIVAAGVVTLVVLLLPDGGNPREADVVDQAVQAGHGVVTADDVRQVLDLRCAGTAPMYSESRIPMDQWPPGSVSVIAAAVQSGYCGSS